ncbi:ABC transporter substrate-binding protein [Thiocystis violacea]|uniref:ABC transporter substrate-binding protein n=1 Tax=Thiocystis violacea TaxID=13725 RepID=UPI001903D04D|nr:sugar ABC transporter substrate-binding protein [Thiocystis violacea]MBK1724881.1 sugar ABC transporter substrate-binding protein [Thiocystis violacea]
MQRLKSLLFSGIALCICCAATLAQAQTTLTIATVDNGDMIRMQRLAERFTAAFPDIVLNWIILDENVLRQRVTTDIATGGGQFDIVTIGTFEAPIWAGRGWLLPLADMPDGYDVDDIMPAIREALSVEGTLYAAPFNGESAFTMYRTDLFEQAGLEMPAAPSWEFIKQAAAALSGKNSDVYGICLRGKPGWGENMALLTAMANAYGARWFDMDWRPRIDSEAWSRALNDYVSLLSEYGPPDAISNGFSETLELFQRGQCAIWIDATVAASFLIDPEESRVAGKVGFALAPDAGLGKRSNWLWSWALAISATSEHQDAAKRFVAWATSREYIELVAKEEGWANVPPGTRMSLYETQAYLDAAPFAAMTLASIQAADPARPCVDEVPYKGIQYVDIPEFPGIGTAVGERFGKALTGEIPTEEALKNAQWVTGKVIQRARRVRDEPPDRRSTEETSDTE